jgi:hypothetical protein
MLIIEVEDAADELPLSPVTFNTITAEVNETAVSLQS